ncbi:hypothetical protein E2C01_100521 [Portunus trituberculatus]|uniref:Uncharacterized protein n=1 Tax=Portunus trituberculatus TaxID=210409 RepID=A0A5B7K751_PORTR|nr:hypothetical protein [Portunus trituberculatus]
MGTFLSRAASSVSNVATGNFRAFSSAALPAAPVLPGVQSDGSGDRWRTCGTDDDILKHLCRTFTALNGLLS